ncbi:glycosyltransferase family 2 protein [Catalinimonas niigatensis]|uniref:glycosyltransferase family 2 protein n=1 Tax=Catalinimonas niigatensis TaxID=1397264 RepID=UPI002665AEF6|nr:glycosyltransferase family A protein [Catalinimonas niigatensis]WPP52903.1 glycosyltransferase family A protein [Catalinimonas niigatensis]
MNPLVSIIIPVYNSEKYIKNTIESCLQQTYTHIEIIIVNDGSKDNSEKIIKGFNDSRLKYYKIANSGPCYARNFGIEKATGDLFQFLDADDVLDQEKLESQVRYYQSHGDEYVYSGIMGFIINDQKQLEQGFDFYYKNLRIEEYFRKMFYHFGKYYTTGMWLLPRKLVEKTHGWDEKVRINNDGEYFSRIILHSKGIVFCPEAIFYYRRDVPMSVSKRFNSKDIYESWLYSYSCYVKCFQRTLNKKTANELGRKALSVYYCNSYPNYPDLLQECKDQIRLLGYHSPSAHGGKTFKLISAIVGVDNALKIKTLKDKGKLLPLNGLFT